MAVLARSMDKLERARIDLEAARRQPDQAFVTGSVDVREYEPLRAAVDAIVAEHGVPDIVVDTAGYARPGFAIDLDVEHYRSMMDLNYFGTVHLVKAVLGGRAAFVAPARQATNAA